MGGFSEGRLFEAVTLAIDSTSLSDPTSLSHSSNRIRFVGLGDSNSFSDSRLSPVILIGVLGRRKQGQSLVVLLAH